MVEGVFGGVSEGDEEVVLLGEGLDGFLQPHHCGHVVRMRWWGGWLMWNGRLSRSDFVMVSATWLVSLIGRMG